MSNVPIIEEEGSKYTLYQAIEPIITDFDAPRDKQSGHIRGAWYFAPSSTHTRYKHNPTASPFSLPFEDADVARMNAEAWASRVCA